MHAETTPNPRVETPEQAARKAECARARERLLLLYRLRRQDRLLHGGQPGQMHAKLTAREIRDLFDDDAVAAKYPLIMTYAQTADLVQVAVDTLKGWFTQGKYAKCVKRDKPARVLRDCFVQKFLIDHYGERE